MPRAVLELKDVEVVLGGRRVLGPLSLVVSPGEHWALLGPNGSGKTTLLNVLSAQRHPSAGAAFVLGERLGRADVRRLREQIGLVSHLVSDQLPMQASALEVVLTGKRGLLAPWWGRFDDDDAAHALELLNNLHCGHLAKQAYGACSQGERQRILLARSLFSQHRLLLLDEPAVGVDLPGREALIAALDALAASPAAPASIQVAHTLEELPTSTTHALLLRDGRVVASGPAPASLSSEALSACFSIAVHVERHNGRYRAEAAGRW